MDKMGRFCIAVFFFACQGCSTSDRTEAPKQESSAQQSTHPIINLATCVDLLQSANEADISRFIAHAEAQVQRLRPVDAAVSDTSVMAGGKMGPKPSDPLKMCVEQLKEHLAIVLKRPSAP